MRNFRKLRMLARPVGDVPAAETCNAWSGQAALLGTPICSVSCRYIGKR